MEVLIRPYIIKDLEALKKVFELNTPKYFAAHELNDFINYLELKPETYLVLEINGAVSGGVGYEYREEDESGRVNWIFITPDFMKSGFGKKAVEHCLRLLKEDLRVKKFIVRTSQHASDFFCETWLSA